jgi:hypothetical protein
MKGVACIALFFTVGNGIIVLSVMVNMGLSVAAYVDVNDVWIGWAPAIEISPVSWTTQFKPPFPGPQFISWLMAAPTPADVVVIAWDIRNVEAPSSNETEARVLLSEKVRKERESDFDWPTKVVGLNVRVPAANASADATSVTAYCVAPSDAIPTAETPIILGLSIVGSCNAGSVGIGW